MPVSSSSNKKPVIDLLKQFNCKNIFELGVGYGQFGKLIKNEIKESKIFGIEIFTKYFSKIPKQCYEHLYNEDMRFFDYKKICEEIKFDVVLAIDVIEHVERFEGELLINKLIDMFPMIIISVPIVDNEQGAFQGNEYEIHRTQWKTNELQKMGFILTFNDDLIGVFYKINQT